MSEQEYALMEANRIHCCEEFFAARASISLNPSAIKCCESGHDAGWRAQQQQITELKRENAELTTFKHDALALLEYRKEKIEELERIIAESKEQPYLGEVAWNGHSVMLYLHNREEMLKLPAGRYKLYAATPIQDGIVAVPVEPSRKMLDAGINAHEQSISYKMYDAYKAMIEASKEKI